MRILARIVAMFTFGTLSASNYALIITGQSAIYQSLNMRKNERVRNDLNGSIASLERGEENLISKQGFVGNRRQRNDIGYNGMESNDGRRLRNWSGKGQGKGTDSKLDICLNRQNKRVATTKYRSLNNMNGEEKNSPSKGKIGTMGIRRKYGRCDSKTRGKGGSSKSKKESKGQTYHICDDYEFSTRQLQQRKVENSNEIKQILDVARGIPRLSIFVDLVERTSLPAILDCKGPFTALIPANRAFRTLDPAIFADLLLRDKSGKLDDIFFSHIIPGRILFNEFRAGNLKALSGDDIKVSLNPLTFHQNATAGTGDIIVANGVIHIVDSVLFTNGKIATRMVLSLFCY